MCPKKFGEALPQGAGGGSEGALRAYSEVIPLVACGSFLVHFRFILGRLMEWASEVQIRLISQYEK